MWRIYLPWPTWLEGIAVLRASAVEHQRRHAELMQARLDQSLAEDDPVAPAYTGNSVSRSIRLAWVRLGISPPATRSRHHR